MRARPRAGHRCWTAGVAGARPMGAGGVPGGRHADRIGYACRSVLCVRGVHGCRLTRCALVNARALAAHHHGRDACVLYRALLRQPDAAACQRVPKGHGRRGQGRVPNLSPAAARGSARYQRLRAGRHRPRQKPQEAGKRLAERVRRRVRLCRHAAPAQCAAAERPPSAQLQKAR